jgi:hypothetical protein
VLQRRRRRARRRRHAQLVPVMVFGAPPGPPPAPPPAFAAAAPAAAPPAARPAYRPAGVYRPPGIGPPAAAAPAAARAPAPRPAAAPANPCVACRAAEADTIFIPCSHKGHFCACLPPGATNKALLARYPHCASCGAKATYYMRVLGT